MGPAAGALQGSVRGWAVDARVKELPDHLLPHSVFKTTARTTVSRTTVSLTTKSHGWLRKKSCFPSCHIRLLVCRQQCHWSGGEGSRSEGADWLAVQAAVKAAAMKAVAAVDLYQQQIGLVVGTCCAPPSL